jgi:formamidopyrimidine-DNA glycosylase
LRLRLETDDGRAVAFTDARRLGRIWLGDTLDRERRITRLGPDAFDALPSSDELRAILGRRKRPIKAVLLDQGVLAGIGNWIANEVLYQAGIAPKRSAASLSTDRDCRTPSRAPPPAAPRKRRRPSRPPARTPSRPGGSECSSW